MKTCNRKDIVNIPNSLSVVRILLIPLFVVLYLGKDPAAYGIWPGLILAVSGLTDMLDGIIARKFNQITALGQILDPIADKLTQATVVVCIAIVNRQNWTLIPLVCVFICKEAIMALGSLKLFRMGARPTAAMWFGKMGTAVFYIIMFLIIIFPNIPDWVITSMVALVALLMVFVLVRYGMVYVDIVRQKKQEGKKNP
jgi:cardiolipin synthase